MAQNGTTEGKDWVVQFEERHQSRDFGNESLWTKRHIFRVPSYVRNLNPEAYCPHLVSLGPYHHGDEKLQNMEDHKVRSVIHLLKKSNRPLIEYVNGMNEVLEDLMESYDQLADKWRDNKHKFVELMIHDGCFLLEILRKFVDFRYGLYSNLDPIFSEYGKYKNGNVILEDMLKIENQVPLLVLYKLVAVENGKTVDECIREMNELVVDFIRKVGNFVFDVEQSPKWVSDTFVHMLDLARKCMVGDLESHEQEQGVIMKSATVFNSNAEVEFKVREKNSLSGFVFDEKKGILYLPEINIYDCTESLLLNLMAFEHFHAGVRQHVASFFYYMDGLIQSIQDSDLLRCNDIITSDKNDDKIVKLIQTLQHDMGFIPNFTLSHVTKPLYDYYDKRTSKWQMRFRNWGSNLWETYFDTPWSVLALLAATLLLALTIAQTVYTVITFYESGSHVLPTHHL